MIATTPDSAKPAPITKGLAAWMLFDWAAQPFFTVVISFIFGPYFVARLTDDPAYGQAIWGYTLVVSGLAIAILSPILGSLADAAGPRKPWITFFAVIKILSLGFLWFAVPGSALIYPAILLVFASIAAECSIVFNDSMMPRLVDQDESGRISNMAWGLGYLGGMIVLIFVILFVAADPQTGQTVLQQAPLFGIDAARGEDARITGPIAALWYAVFILPMLLFTPDAPRTQRSRHVIRNGLTELKHTFAELRQRTGLLRFLLARMIYQDGINAIIVLGGTYAAGLFGWRTLQLGAYGILLNIIAIGACLGAARLDAVIGSKRIIVLCLISLIFATVGMISTGPDHTLFFLPLTPPVEGAGLFSSQGERVYLAFSLLVGLTFGPVQASSRSYMARSITVDEAGRYFGIYALTGRATSFLAPAAVATVTLISGSATLGMATLILFLLAGLVILWKTPYPAT